MAIATGSIPAAAQSNALTATTTPGQTTKPFTFEVVSIRPHPADGYAATNYLPDGLQLLGFNVWAFINNAYSSREGSGLSLEIRNMPAWAYSEHYDLDARVAPEDRQAWHKLQDNLYSSEMTTALQAVLRDRFKLSVHFTIEQKSCLDLVVSTHGPKLQPAIPGAAAKIEPGKRGKLGDGFFTFEGDNENFLNVSMPELVRRLNMISNHDQLIQDKTGLSGRYDFTLPWYGQDPSTNGLDRMPVSSIGLALKPGKAPVTVINIDHIEKPDAN